MMRTQILNCGQSWRNHKLGTTVQCQPGQKPRLLCLVQATTHQAKVGWVFRLAWTRTEPINQSNAGPLAGYPNPLLTLYEPCVDDVTGLIASADFNVRITLSCIPAMVTIHVKSIRINYAMFANPIAINAVKSAQIHSWWFAIFAMIDPARRNSDPPHLYISVVN